MPKQVRHDGTKDDKQKRRQNIFAASYLIFKPLFLFVNHFGFHNILCLYPSPNVGEGGVRGIIIQNLMRTFFKFFLDNFTNTLYIF
jgi:hypothetical protein